MRAVDEGNKEEKEEKHRVRKVRHGFVYEFKNNFFTQRAPKSFREIVQRCPCVPDGIGIWKYTDK